MKLSKAIEEFLREIKVNKSHSTAVSYGSDLHRLLILTTHDTVLQFTPELIRRYFINASEAGLKMSTLHRKRATISEFCKWGVKRKLWEGNPCEDLPRIKRPDTLPRPFSKDEMERLLALELAPRERVVRALLFLTGLRVSPLCAIKVGDISHDPPLLRALVKGAKVQSIHLHPALGELLYAYVLSATDLKPQSFLLLKPSGKMYRRKDIERMAARWGEIAGVVSCTPHRFRHSFATNLLQAGVDIRIIKEALGHADIKSTLIYTQVTDENLQAAILKLPWDGRS